MKDGCPESDDVQSKLEGVSVYSVDPIFQGTFHSLSVEANAPVHGSSIILLELPYFLWYLNGKRSSLLNLSCTSKNDWVYTPQPKSWAAKCKLRAFWKSRGSYCWMPICTDTSFQENADHTPFSLPNIYLPEGKISRGYTDVDYFEGTTIIIILHSWHLRRKCCWLTPTRTLHRDPMRTLVMVDVAVHDLHCEVFTDNSFPL